MRKGRVLLLEGYLVSQMNHWILYLIPLTLLGLCEMEKPVFLSWLLLSLVPMVFSTIRRLTNGFLIFMFSHLGCAAASLLLPVNSWVEKLMILLILIFYLIYSFYLRLKTEDRMEQAMHPCAAVGICGVGLLFQKYQGTQDWNESYIYALILFLGLYFFLTYLDHYLYFMVVNDINKGRIPEKAMFRSGIKLVAMFCVIAVSILFLTSGVGWVGQIATALKNFIFWLLHTIFKKQEQVSEESVVEVQEPLPNDNGGFITGEPAETFWLWIVLEKIYIAAVYITVVAVIIWLIYSLIRFLYNKFHDSIELWNKEPEDGVVDIREKCEVEHRVKRKHRPSLADFLSAKERIRKIYKKEVWASRLLLAESGEPRLLERMTAKECGRKLERTVMTDIYEKARYSDEVCTTEDIRAAKS